MRGLTHGSGQCGARGATLLGFLLRRAVELLEQSGITLHDLADESHIPLEEIRQYVAVPNSPGRLTVEV